MIPIDIPLAEFINRDEEILTLYIHTKDNRMLAFKDITSDFICSGEYIYFSHYLWGRVFDVVMLREDFSYFEYYVEQRSEDSKKELDELNSFLDEEIEEWDENLVEDLI